MTARHHVIAIGNALVDVITSAPPEFLAERSIAKGSMRLIPAEEAETLYAAMGPGREISGGSAANTVAGMAALGARPAFVGRVAADQLGGVFAHDIRAAGVEFTTAPSAGGAPTGRCLIVVTPDGDRTMNTYLGACQELSEADLDPASVAAAEILYLEGYLWDPPAPRAAMKKAIAVARHRADFQDLLAGHVDLMFGNEHEVCALYQTQSLDEAMAELAKHACIAVVTRSSQGAIVLEGGRRHIVAGEQVAKVVDSTGAGDMFAGGFMAAMIEGRSLPDCARVGCITAAEVISHYGARPEADLKALVKARLG